MSLFGSSLPLLADHLPWVALVAEGVALTSSGALMRTLALQCPDVDSLPDSAILARQTQLAHLLHRYGYGYALHWEAQRRPARAYPESPWTHPVARLIDAERAALFADAGVHFETDVYLTLVMQTPTDRRASGARWLYEHATDQAATPYRAIVEGFAEEVEVLQGLLAPLFVEVRPLSDDETMTYLHRCVSPKWHPVATPQPPVFLSHALVDHPLTGGEEPQLGAYHLRVLSVKTWPNALLPGILGTLGDLPMPYRLALRWLPLNKEQALKETRRAQRRWLQKRKGLLTMLREEILKKESAMVEPVAARYAQDAVDMAEAIAAGDVSAGYLSLALVLWHQDLAVLHEQVALTERTLNGEGFITVVERQHAVDAWLATMPGNLYHHTRSRLLTSANLVDLEPSTAPWAGPERNAHLDGPPLCYATTGTSTPFRLVLHDGDVGHCAIIGPSGSGKDVLCWFLAAQFCRYPGAQVFALDKGHGSRCMTAAMGGTYEALASDGSSAGQPLAGVDDPQERLWALEWLGDIVEQAHQARTPQVQEALWEALGALAGLPRGQRTMTAYTLLVQDTALREVLRPYTLDGPYGVYFDGDQDQHTMTWWHVLAMDEVLKVPTMLPALLGYRFHCIEKTLTVDRPTLLICNEFGEYLDHPLIVRKLRSWLTQVRKLNTSVWLATQSISQVTDSILAAAGNDIPTRILLPNARAVEGVHDGGVGSYYAKWGVNERQRAVLASAMPKRHYYFMNRHGSRLFDLRLGAIALAFCGAGSGTDLAHMAQMMQTSPETFPADWLRHRHLDWAADALEQQTPTAKGTPWTADVSSWASVG